MPSPLVSPRVLLEVPDARIKHAEGMTHSEAGRYDEALFCYDEALGIIGDSEPTLDTRVQASGVIRDTGLNFLRQAVATRSREVLSIGLMTLNESLEWTGRAINENCHRLPYLGLADIKSEHGATLSIISRLGTVKKFIFEDLVVDEIIEAQFTQAHIFLEQGSNGHARVENSMVAARHALASGDQKEAEKWKREAYRSVRWTMRHDTRNMGRVALTMAGRRGLGLISQGAALVSIGSRP